jgi:hypothetical protein
MMEAPGDSLLPAMERFLMGAGRRKGQGREPVVNTTTSSAQGSAVGDAGKCSATDRDGGGGVDERPGPACAAGAEGRSIDVPPGASEAKEVVPARRRHEDPATGAPAAPASETRTPRRSA